MENTNNNRQRQLSGGCHKHRHAEECSSIKNSSEQDMASVDSQMRFNITKFRT